MITVLCCCDVSLIRTCQSARPSCRQEVVTWFIGVEKPRGAGVNPSTGKVSKWFHGELISYSGVGGASTSLSSYHQ